MTNHMQNAIEAGVQKLVGEGLLDQEWYDGYREEVARRTLNAMLPHLRAMIAGEIMDRANQVEPTARNSNPSYVAYLIAADIAKGPQQ